MTCLEWANGFTTHFAKTMEMTILIIPMQFSDKKAGILTGFF
jgi:hypothetical protein